MREQLSYAMRVWEIAVGRKLFSYQGEEGRSGDEFESLDDSLEDNSNGHFLNAIWSKTGKSRQVLATTVWENTDAGGRTMRTSDIRYNVEYYLLGDSLSLKATEEKEVADLISLSIHEIGHFLGLAHIDASVDRDSIMNPYLYIGEGLISRRLSEGDVERIQKIYSCAGEACDVNNVLDEVDALTYSDGTK